jgi:hypothetical protein
LHRALAALSSAHHENRRRRRAGEKLGIGDPQHRRRVDHDEIEDFQTDGYQGKNPGSAEQIAGIGRDRPGGDEFERLDIGLLHQFRWRGAAGQIVAEPERAVLVQLYM